MNGNLSCDAENVRWNGGFLLFFPPHPPPIIVNGLGEIFKFEILLEKLQGIVFGILLQLLLKLFSVLFLTGAPMKDNKWKNYILCSFSDTLYSDRKK